jgi:hypothetical protein
VNALLSYQKRNFDLGLGDDCGLGGGVFFALALSNHSFAIIAR